jgi:hypothetical protein
MKCEDIGLGLSKWDGVKEGKWSREEPSEIADG